MTGQQAIDDAYAKLMKAAAASSPSSSDGGGLRGLPSSFREENPRSTKQRKTAVPKTNAASKVKSKASGVNEAMIQDHMGHMGG